MRALTKWSVADYHHIRNLGILAGFGLGIERQEQSVAPSSKRVAPKIV